MLKKTCSLSFVVLLGMLVLLVFSSPGRAQEGNLLKNPSFEDRKPDGTPAKWGLSKNVLPGKKGAPALKLATPAHQGANAAQLSFGPALDWAYVSQTYWKLLSPGEKYVFSAWVRSDKPARVSLVLSALGKDPQEGERVLEYVKREWVDTTSEWTRCAVGIEVPPGGQYVRLWCIVQLYTPNVTLSIDDARLVHENPKPVGETSLHPTHSVGCVRTDAAPVIDGKLDDVCWQRAGVAADFTNLATAAAPKPSQKTSVYLLHDKKNLYVAYRCFESDLPSLKAEKSERDAAGLWGDDCVELFLLPPDSSFPGIAIVGTKYYYLLVNSLGTQGDNVGLLKVDQWDGKWQARTAREKDAWTIEMRIPFRQLDSRPREGAPWRVNFTRSEKRLKENSTWAPLDQKFHDPARFADMYFVKEPGEAALVLAAAVEAQAGKIRTKWLGALTRTDSEIERLSPMLRSETSAEAKDLARQLAKARKRVKDLVRVVHGMKPQEVLDSQEKLGERVATSVGTANVLANATDSLLQAEGGPAFVVRSAPAITNARILPTSLVSGEGVAEALSLAACPGEYESGSFLVTPACDVEGVTVTCSDLASADGAIDASRIDVKLVKCWYQSFGEPWTGGVSFQRGKVLLPELLVYDDDLVRVDLEKKRNLLRVTDPKTDVERYEDVTGENEALTKELVIRDAEALLPVDVPAGQVRQFWVTVHVPDDAKAGVYEGIVSVTFEGSGVELPIRLTVHPFDLARSVVEQSIFYRGKVQATDVPVIDSDTKTETQYEAEMRDMVAHGVTAPLWYQPPADMDLMRTALEIRQRAGVDTQRFYFCAWGVDPWDVNDESRRVLGAVKALAREFGYREFYNFGSDEPTVEKAREQVGPGEFIHELGWKHYYACNVLTDSAGALREDLWGAVKDTVDMFVVGRPPNPDLAATLHEAGVEIYNYANPQCGIEEPETYRRNYGLLLWKAGYDGAMDYAYQHGSGGPLMWNDFDAADETIPYRDHVMAYATSDGVVDTIQWEGYREGVDDLRYLSTLLEAIESADATAQARAEAQVFVKSIDPSGDLDALRDEIVRHILTLRAGPR